MTRREASFAASKFAAPAASMLVTREALIRRIDDGSDSALTVVVGSPGSGKTSLLGQWVRGQHPGNVSWLSCDAADLDPARFWRAAIASMASIRPGFGSECLDLLELNETIDADFLESLLGSCEVMHPPASLVVDDLQLAGDAVQEQIRFLIHRGFGHLRILVASRAEPALGLARLRVGERVCEIGETDLRFRQEETAALLHMLGAVVDDHEATLVHQRTEGWAAGVHLAAIALRDVEQVDSLVAGLDRSDGLIGQYLWSEVFEAQPMPVRRFLLDTCIADQLSPELAAHLSPGSPVTLFDVEAANLLTVRLDPNGRLFRYHHLLADLLRSRLRASDPDHELELHARAARWHAQRGDTALAFRHAWRAGQRRAVMAAMHERVLDWRSGDLLPGFEDTDRQLTDDDLTAATGPAASYAAALLTKGYLEDADRLAARIELVVAPDEDSPTLRQLRTVRAMCAIARGDTRAAIRHGQPVVERIGRSQPYEPWSGLALTAIARAHAWQGEHRKAAELLHALHPEPLEQIVYLETISAEALCAVMAGDLSAATRHAQRLLDQLATGEPPYTDIGMQARAVLGIAALERGNILDARRLLEHVGAADSTLRTPARVLAKVALSRIWRADGDLAAAFAVLEDARNLVHDQPFGSGIVDHVRTRQAAALIVAGDVRAAADIADGIGVEHLRLLLQARVARALGEREAAYGAAQRMVEIAQGRRQMLDAHLALLAASVGEDAADESVAETVFELASAEGFVFPLVESGADALEAVRRVSRHHEGTEFTASLMAIRPSTPPPWAPRPGADALTERERTILRYLATSLSYTEIGRELHVSINTVKTHARNIGIKLQASSRADIVAAARAIRYL